MDGEFGGQSNSKNKITKINRLPELPVPPAKKTKGGSVSEVEASRDLATLSDAVVQIPPATRDTHMRKSNRNATKRGISLARRLRCSGNAELVVECQTKREHGLQGSCVCFVCVGAGRGVG